MDKKTPAKVLTKEKNKSPLTEQQTELIRRAIVLHTAGDTKKWHTTQWNEIRQEWPEILECIDWKKGEIKPDVYDHLTEIASEETLAEISAREAELEKRAKYCYGPAYTEFFEAIAQDSPSKMREMIGKGMPFRQEGGEYGNIYRDFPLIHAIRKDSLKATELLLKLGANPNAPKFSKKDKKLYLSEPVREAASSGNKILLDLLLEHGAAVPDQTEPDGKTTIVNLAAKTGNLGLVNRLKAKMKEYTKFRLAIESADSKELGKYFKLGYKPWEVEKRSLLKGILSPKSGNAKSGNAKAPLVSNFLQITQKDNELVAKIPALKVKAAAVSKICLEILEDIFTKNKINAGIYLGKPKSQKTGERNVGAGEIKMDFPNPQEAKNALKMLRNLHQDKEKEGKKTKKPQKLEPEPEMA